MLMWLTSKISNISTGKISFVTRIPNQTQDLNFYILPTIHHFLVPTRATTLMIEVLNPFGVLLVGKQE